MLNFTLISSPPIRIQRTTKKALSPLMLSLTKHPSFTSPLFPDITQALGIVPIVRLNHVDPICQTHELYLKLYQSRSWHEGKKIGIKDLISTLYCIVRYRFQK